MYIDILLIAVGLSMDAFAVSIANGVTTKKLEIINAFKMAFFFGFFQALMPFLGWLLGSSFSSYIQNFDHWIAFLLLLAIGGKMIYESFSEKKEDEERIDYNSYKMLFILAVATSIDALAVGLSFAFLEIKIATPCLIIGGITFVISFAGVVFGNKIGHFFENKIEIIGGLILIGIGTKILLTHLLV